MRYSSIRAHLKPYVIVSRRKTTINHAFAAAIAPSDTYDEDRIRDAIFLLEQDPDDDLVCVYCSAPAQTWDHVFATVKKSAFSGHGHRLGNLVPCCKQCNSAKGNKDWRQYLAQLGAPDTAERESRIASYLAKHAKQDFAPIGSASYDRLMRIKQEIMTLLAEADRLAKDIRDNAAESPVHGS
jgi:HNH endonuclease